MANRTPSWNADLTKLGSEASCPDSDSVYTSTSQPTPAPSKCGARDRERSSKGPVADDDHRMSPSLPRAAFSHASD